MTNRGKPIVLMADDDDDDCILAKNAFKEAGARGALHFVEDGVALFDYLNGTARVPALILLDLNMPRKDGRHVLKEIKSTPTFRKIPVVVFTTSREEKDRVLSGEMGADSFITKPAMFEGWVKIMKSLADEWLGDAEDAGA